MKGRGARPRLLDVRALVVALPAPAPPAPPAAPAVPSPAPPALAPLLPRLLEVLPQLVEALRLELPLLVHQQVEPVAAVREGVVLQGRRAVLRVHDVRRPLVQRGDLRGLGGREERRAALFSGTPAARWWKSLGGNRREGLGARPALRSAKRARTHSANSRAFGSVAERNTQFAPGARVGHSFN